MKFVRKIRHALADPFQKIQGVRARQARFLAGLLLVLTVLQASSLLFPMRLRENFSPILAGPCF